jgi:hypothetical protein
MTGRLCILVEYCYRRKPIPKSRLWHLNCYKATEQPATQASGVLDVSDAGGDQVSIFIAVPCGEHGEVDADTQAEYEDLADQKFKEIRPDAELA